MASRPQNVGIKAMELYFPNQCVDQAELEKFDGVAAGKYTIGLGQTKMSFCDDREDIYSFALTTVSSLLRKYAIDPKSIGRLEVGTETLLDKSKSCKSVLMQLFEPSGNTNVEGVDTVNACYGGTNALFNAINWVESSAWDGRDAIVVAGDIAIYTKGNARPTGGAGCIAMLVGPDAPLVFDPGMRGSFVKHAYDFYKADFTSEYAIVDGQFSIRCYTEAVDACYRAYHARQADLTKRLQGYGDPKPSEPSGPSSPAVANGAKDAAEEDSADATAATAAAAVAAAAATATSNGNVNSPHSSSAVVNGYHTPQDEEHKTPLDAFDHIVFHAPTCKLVAKSYARMLYNDFLENPNSQAFESVPAALRDLDYAASLTDRNLEKTFMGLTKKKFAARVQPGIEVPTMCGNMYCGSVYGSLVSLLANVGAEQLRGRKVGIFSYGSGLASSFFSLHVKGDVSGIIDRVDLHQRLDARRTLAPEAYDEMCNLREKAHLQKSYTPSGSIDSLVPGTYYLTEVDHMFRRKYLIKA